MTKYEKGYKAGEKEYINNQIGEAYVEFKPGSEEYRGFADGYCEKIEAEFQEWKYDHDQ
jgi:hypothetical protein